MSLSNFTVPEIEEYNGLPDGEYTAQVDHVDYITNNFGNHYVVNWKIMRPSEYEGRIHQERFNIEHSNDQVRHIAIQNFARLCVDIGGLSKGDTPKEDDFLFKVANILISSKISKDGKKYTNVVRRELVDTQSTKETALPILGTHAAIGIAGSGKMPFEAAPQNIPLNDEVPF